MTHLANEVRSAFQNIVEVSTGRIGDPRCDDEELKAASVNNYDELLGLLEDCDDIMPASLCEELQVPAGSTFARGVRSERDAIALLETLVWEHKKAS